MTTPLQTSRSHSADVRMEFRCDGQTIALGQLGPGFFIAHEAVELTSNTGTLHVSIDGNESNWLVRLPDGFHPGQRTPYCQLSEVEAERQQPSAA